MTLEYVHEFLDDQRSVQFSFVQDPQNRRFLFETTPPDRDYLNLGLGVSMVLPSGLQPFLNFRDMLAYRRPQHLHGHARPAHSVLRWGALEGPPKPPFVRSVPAEPGRSSVSRGGWVVVLCVGLRVVRNPS